ncbi:hypothetical protein [Janthinobacterium sp.]|uniref:hypothetical protein n=1 Tax=Janthinobacterium sp. TaxID=1871054 RepID=UPI00293D4F4B|nr:hypothetical protein [Janthinobacterium sp.]
MSDNGDMPIDRPVDETTAWTTVGGNATKKKVPDGSPGQSSKKSTKNGQDFGAIGNIIYSTPQPRRNPSAFVTRINFKVIPTKETKTISIPHSICRIVTSLQAADKTARIIAVDEHENEIEFKGSEDLQKNTDANVDYVNQFLDQPKNTKSNQLVGLIILRSDKSFSEIKKHQLTQNGLNTVPRIYLTANYLDVVTPTEVGFFVNTAPRADKPETFYNRFSLFMDQFNENNIKYQFEYGPIWAPNNRVSVFKLMAAYDDKDALRSIMENYYNGPNEDTYVCMTEYSSLPEAQKIKIIRTQAEYAANHRSLFIEGYNSVRGKLRPGEQDDDMYPTVAHWIYDRPTSYGKHMFTRVYGAVDGIVELHAHKDNIKEATEWARLAKREIAEQLNTIGMTEVFIYPEEALDAMESLPAWKPHSLSARIDLMAEPTTIIPQTRRGRRTVNIDYSKSNQKWKGNAAPSRKKSEAAKVRARKNNKTTSNPTFGNQTAWGGYGPPSTSTKTHHNNYQYNDIEANNASEHTDDEEMEATTVTMATETAKSKIGINKYKAAAEATEKRLGTLEEGMIKLQAAQQISTKNIINVSTAQRIANNKIDQTSQNIDKLVKIVTDNREDADDKFEAAAQANKEHTEQLSQAFLLMKALDSSMQSQQTLIRNMEARMKPLPESPVRKKQLNTLPTPPRKPTTTYMHETAKAPKNTWEAYYHDSESNTGHSSNNEGHQNLSSDADMEGVAETK